MFVTTCCCYRNGSDAVDDQLRDLPAVGSQHWQRCCDVHQLVLQSHRVDVVPVARGGTHAIRCVLHTTLITLGLSMIW